MARHLTLVATCGFLLLGCSSIAGIDDLELRAREPRAGEGGPDASQAGASGRAGSGDDAGSGGDAGGSGGTQGGAWRPPAQLDGGTPDGGSTPMPVDCSRGWMWSEAAGECIDLCAAALCDPNAQCTVIGETARCDCIAPYVGEGTSCTFDASCALLDCDDHAECVVTGQDQRECECLEGYVGSGEDCTNRDDCAGDPCEGRGSCSDLVGGYDCACFDGYSGTDCATDVCTPNPCPANIPCARTATGHECLPMCADQPGEKCAKGELCARNEDCATNECDQESHTCWDSRCISPAGLETVLIGDSYVNYPAAGGVRIPLQNLATTQGTALSGFRDYAVPGAKFADVAAQYATAKNQPPGETVVVLTGGLSDILLSCDDSAPGNAECKQLVDDMVDDLETLLAQMAADGVDHVIYFFYPYITSSITNTTIDYAYLLVRPACVGRSNCHFIDLRAVFDNHLEWIGADGIHPSGSGYTAIAQEIWDVMKAECIYQP